jgi:hypothetical protein
MNESKPRRRWLASFGAAGAATTILVLMPNAETPPRTTRPEAVVSAPATTAGSEPSVLAPATTASLAPPHDGTPSTVDAEPGDPLAQLAAEDAEWVLDRVARTESARVLEDDERHRLVTQLVSIRMHDIIERTEPLVSEQVTP